MIGVSGNVLVTGASGFIGSQLVQRLETMPDIRIFTLSRRATATRRRMIHVQEGLQNLTPETWKTADVDFFDYVFHLGAFTPKSAIDEPIGDIYDSNVDGTRSLLSSLPEVRRRIVFASTLDVYSGSASNEPIDEESEIRPHGVYAASKLFGEHQLREYASRSGCELAILRYGHVFGPGEERYAKLIPTVIRRLIGGETPVLSGDGTALRDLLYIGDAIEATIRAAGADFELLDPLNIVRGTSVTVRSVIELLMDITSHPGTLSEVAAAPGRSLQFDNRQMRAALGQWELVSLEDGLRCEVDHFRGLAN